MKKCLCLLLVLLLLTGCAGQGEQEPKQETQPVQEGLYDGTSELEQQTSGAVRVYPLPENGYTNLVMMGSKVLLLSDGGDAMVLYGDDGIVSATGVLEGYRPEAASMDVDVKGIASYVMQSREVVLLNPQPQQTNRIQLPEDIQGEPVISLASNEIFYCRGGEIRAMNMENGVARLIKSHTVAEQTLTGCYFDGKVIRCESKDQNGAVRQIYLSAENGVTLSEDTYVYGFETYEDRHFIRRLDNRIDQIIVGTMTGESQLLELTRDRADFVTEALAMNGAVSYLTGADGVTLSFHDLTLGQTTAQVTLPDIGAPISIAADQHYVWLLTEDAQQEGGQVVLRWDVSKSLIAEPVVVTATLFTAAAPDTEGLELCKERARDLNDTYGVRIAVWDDAVKNTGDYKAVAEHQPAILNEMMAQLETALQLYPDSFLRKTIKTGWIRICLVRSIKGGEDYVQFWDGGDCCILISSQANIADSFLEIAGYAIDSRVLGSSRAYDTWNEMNPEGFAYTSEADGQTQDAAAYMEGESRAFVNMKSIGSPNEDRRQLFVAAMTQNNEAVFTSAAMQAKLRRMCEGIREAYDLENKKELFRWEQYLTEPMVQIGE